jgi:hypothetical protein
MDFAPDSGAIPARLRAETPSSDPMGRTVRPSSSFTRPITFCGLEGLGEHAVTARAGRPGSVNRFEGAGQEHHGDVRKPRRLLHVRGHFVAGLPRHSHVDQDDVRRDRVEPGNGLIAVTDGHDVDILVGEGQLDHTLNRHAVVGQEQSLWHLGYIGANKETR